MARPRRIRIGSDELRAVRELRQHYPDSALVFTTERGGRSRQTPSTGWSSASRERMRGGVRRLP